MPTYSFSKIFVLIKYEALDSFLQRQVMEFVDYLLSVKNTVKTVDTSLQCKKINRRFTCNSI